MLDNSHLVPQYLGRDSIRLFEAGRDQLWLACAGLAFPRYSVRRQQTSRFASEIGLVGAAAESALAACLVHHYGRRFILRSPESYKTATNLLADFRDLLGLPLADLEVFVAGVTEGAEHISRLRRALEKFGLLFTMRAGGLHAGQGPSREVTIVAAREVAAFYELLARSSKLNPYIQDIPVNNDLGIDRYQILTETLEQLDRESELPARAGLVSSVYLLLPQLPVDEPDWLQRMQRIAVSPRERDVVFLIDACQDALPIEVVRARAGGDAIPVRIEPNNPRAVPIQPQQMRREFTQRRDQWAGDVANANGRWTQSRVLDLPPPEFVLDLFSEGIDEAGISPGVAVHAQESWPFIARAIDYTGTGLPHWFLVRKTENPAELTGIMNARASKFTRTGRERIVELETGIQAIVTNTGLSSTIPWVSELLRAQAQAEANAANFADTVKERAVGEKMPGPGLIAWLAKVADGAATPGQAIHWLIGNPEAETAEIVRYWVPKLVEAVVDDEDRRPLIALLRTDLISSPPKTLVRKVIRRLDFLAHGPPVGATAPTVV